MVAISNQSQNAQDKYIKSLDLEFEGKVKSIETSDHGTGRVFLEVINSNHVNYDVRYISKYYICKVELDKAELIITNPNDFLINDIVEISCKKDSAYLFNPQKILKEKWSLYVVDYWNPPMGKPFFFRK